MVAQNTIDQFLNAPDQFMRSNLIRWSGGGPEDQQNILVVMEEDGTGRMRTGAKFLGLGNAKATVPKFVLRWANNPMRAVDPGAITFQVVWSGYRAGEGRSATLLAVGGPSLMLTPELTGCTVVCVPHADGSAAFSHYNFKRPDANETLDDDDMRAAAAVEHAQAHTTLSKGEYRARTKRGGNIKVTVVGHRHAGHWEFWAQYREDKASGEQVRHVEEL